MKLEVSWYKQHLVLAPQNTDQEGEFIIDSLYLTPDNKLHCFSRGETCLKTGKLQEMIKHRQEYHPLLEARFSHNIWTKTLPQSLLDDNDSNNNDSVSSDYNNDNTGEEAAQPSLRQFWMSQLM